MGAICCKEYRKPRVLQTEQVFEKHVTHAVIDAFGDRHALTGGLLGVFENVIGVDLERSCKGHPRISQSALCRIKGCANGTAYKGTWLRPCLDLGWQVRRLWRSEEQLSR